MTMGLTLRRTARRINRLKGACMLIPSGYLPPCYQGPPTCCCSPLRARMVCYSFLVRLFHSLLYASLSRRTRLDLAPPLADRFVSGFSIDYGPVLLRRPFGFPSQWTPCPPQTCRRWLQVHLGCIRLSLSCRCRLLHTFLLLRPARNYPRFWI
jgi:hypothetical protein